MIDPQSCNSQEVLNVNFLLRFASLVGVVIMLAQVSAPVKAQEAPESPEVSACLPGAGYASGCDVDQDGDVDVFDIQLTAGRWNSNGVYISGHTHWGETWTGDSAAHGLRVEHTAASGDTSGLVGVSASTAGRGVFGYASNTNGQTDGVLGISESIWGRGVRGLATATSGTNFGLYGESRGNSGSGVFGYASSYTGTTYGVGGVSASASGRGLYGMTYSTSGQTYGVYGQSDSTDGRGVYGSTTAASGATYGVQGQSASTSGRGVYGVATATTGIADGVAGQSASASGRGVYGLASAGSGYTYGVYGRSESSTGYGVYGYAPAASGSTFGVAGQSASSAGYGVFGETTALSGVTYGVYGQSISPDGRGVYGRASASSGTTYGVYGQSESTDGRGVYGIGKFGVYGRSDSTSGYGLYGIATAGGSGTTYGIYAQSNSASGYAGYFIGYGADAAYIENSGGGRALQAYASNDTAIWGKTDSGTAGVDGRANGTTGRGVYGRATSTTGVNYGVYGRTDSPSGYGGYFVGNLHTTGTLSKAAGAFKIDHPLDPANQYLYHSFVESPDMMNIYNGNVTTDAEGLVVVMLPEWFQALNRDFRYQLTVIGQFAQAIVAQEIKNNRFVIRTDKPQVKVSWQVTGIRQDAYANAHRIPVEEEKPAGEAGLYLHPLELGQPKELGLDYQRSREQLRQP